MANGFVNVAPVFFFWVLGFGGASYSVIQSPIYRNYFLGLRLAPPFGSRRAAQAGGPVLAGALLPPLSEADGGEVRDEPAQDQHDAGAAA